MPVRELPFFTGRRRSATGLLCSVISAPSRPLLARRRRSAGWLHVHMSCSPVPRTRLGIAIVLGFRTGQAFAARLSASEVEVLHMEPLL